jgi:hypothetical protein
VKAAPAGAADKAPNAADDGHNCVKSLEKLGV